MKSPSQIFKEQMDLFQETNKDILEENTSKALILFQTKIEEKFNILNPMAIIGIEIPLNTFSIDWKKEIQIIKSSHILRNNGWEIIKAIEDNDILKITFNPEYPTKDIQFFKNNKVLMAVEVKKTCEKTCEKCEACKPKKVLTSIFDQKEN